MDPAPNAKDIQFSIIITVLPIVQQMPTITEKHALVVLLHKNGMEPNVLIDAVMEKYGILLLKPVSAHQVNSGTDTLALSVQTEELGMSILKAVNAQSPQPGTELPALFVQEEEFTTT